MQPKARGRIRNQLAFLKQNAARLVIDADTHITGYDLINEDIRAKMVRSDNYYHGRPINAEELLKEMQMAEVDMSLVWQNPAATIYVDDEDENFNRLYNANKYIYESAISFPEKLIPAGWTDPKALGYRNALKMVDICVNEFGFAIVKMNPAQNGYPIDSEQVIKTAERIIACNAVPAFHYGADTPFTPAAGLTRIAETFTGHPVLAVHMGGGGAGYLEAEQMYHDSRLLGMRHPNIKFILSAKRDTHIESDLITYQMAGEPFKNNIFCASDAPYGRQTWNFGGYRLMFRSLINGTDHTDQRLQTRNNLFTTEDMQNYLGGNFARFMIGIYSGITSS